MASAWLGQVARDPDLQVDTRVAIPIVTDLSTGQVRCWGTIGVGSTVLGAEYARPPRTRPAKGGRWQGVLSEELAGASYRIAVDEFAEFELPAGRVLDRAEFRAICDQHRTRDAIRAALGALR